MKFPTILRTPSDQPSDIRRYCRQIHRGAVADLESALRFCGSCKWFLTQYIFSYNFYLSHNKTLQRLRYGRIRIWNLLSASEIIPYAFPERKSLSRLRMYSDEAGTTETNFCNLFAMERRTDSVSVLGWRYWHHHVSFFFCGSTTVARQLYSTMMLSSQCFLFRGTMSKESRSTQIMFLASFIRMSITRSALVLLHSP